MTSQLFMEDRIHTELEAYLLGLFYADGSVSHFSYGAYRLFSITLKAEDKNFLQKICDIINKELGTNYTIKFQEKTNSYKLTICKKTFVQRLVFHGIIPNKTYSFDNSLFINLYDELKPHFIRGYFDGDGSVYITKENKAVLNIVSYNKNIIESIFIYYYTKFGVGFIKEEYSEKNNNYYYRFCLSGNKSVKAFGDFIYKNCTTVFMLRKRKIFESIAVHKTKNMYIGLSKYFNKVKVEISNNNKKYYLGLFPTVKEALEKYNEKAKELNKPIQIYKGEELYE